MINLEEERVNRGYSIASLAKELGISPMTLRRAETGRSVPRPEAAKAIADKYGYRVTEIWPVEERTAA